MAVTNCILWLSNIVLVITLTFSNAGGKRNFNYGAQLPGQAQESTTRPTDVVKPKLPPYANLPSEDGFASFQNLPDSYKKLFLSVQHLKNKTDTFLASEPGKNSRLVYDRDTQKVIDAHLEPLPSRIQLTLVPDTWTSMTHNLGCCPSLDYWNSDRYLTNIHGIRRKLVHFPNNSPPMYQYIYHSTCVIPIYGANGHCVQGYVTMTLAVWDDRCNPPIAFDEFYIPSFCKCLHY